MRVLTGTDEASIEQAYKEQIYQRTVAGNRGLVTATGSNGTSGGMWQGSAITTTSNSAQPKGPMP
jgi:hypothetical protein